MVEKHRLYCCFVDFRKAFDYVDRVSLWYKLLKLGLRGKLLSTIKAIYKSVQSCVVHNGKCSDYFVNNIGLMQWDILSPLMFSFFVNYFETTFIENGASNYDFDEISLFLLLCADDLVLFPKRYRDYRVFLITCIIT